MAEMTAQMNAADFNRSTPAAAAVSGNALRPVLYTVLSLKLAVAAFLLASVSISPPLSAESRYLLSEPAAVASR